MSSLMHLASSPAQAQEERELKVNERSASLEVASARIAEVMRNMFELKREVAMCKDSGQPSLTATQVLKFVEGRMQRKADLVEKLTMKCTALKVVSVHCLSFMEQLHTSEYGA